LKIASLAGTADYERGEDVKLKLSKERNVVLEEAFKIQERNFLRLMNFSSQVVHILNKRNCHLSVVFSFLATENKKRKKWQ
jgi:hypothetical protein